MLVEGYIAIAALVAIACLRLIAWADGRYQDARRADRLARRHG